jgi:hypothetical protein
MRWRFLGAALGYRHILLHGLKPHQYLDVPVFGFNMRVRSYCLYVMVKIHVFVLKASCYQRKVTGTSRRSIRTLVWNMAMFLQQVDKSAPSR